MYPARLTRSSFRGRGPVFHTFREALGDLEMAVERTFVDGDWCTALCRVKGKHAGMIGWVPNPVTP
jgi:hypothetical protein